MIDLQLFTPHRVYERLFNNESVSDKIEAKYVSKNDDFIFYRKRILQLIKDLVKGKKFTPEIHASFEEFSRNAVQYFMFLDKADMIQDSNGLTEEESSNHGKNSSNFLPPIYESEEQHLANQLLYKEPVAPITRKMDDFVIKKNESEINTIIPTQKTYNIKQEKFKVKGVDSVLVKKKRNKKMKLAREKVAVKDNNRRALTEVQKEKKEKKEKKAKKQKK